jgi:hypothetical protein
MSARSFLASLTSPGFLSPRREAVVTGSFILGAAAILLAMLVLPGATYIGNFVHDIMIFYGAADRVLDGQVPNRDFHTPLGPLAYLLPAFGLWLGGSLGGMMPLATAAFVGLAAPLLIYVCATRLPLLFALGFAAYLLLLFVVPLNPGDPPDFTSFAMFYNRFCWGLLSLLFLMILPRKDGIGHWAADAAVIALLLLLMLYLKVSYTAFGVLFCAGLILFRHMRVAGPAALLLTAAAAVVIELFWGGTAAYLADIRMAADASGAVRGTLFTLGRTVLANLTDGLIFLAVLVLALVRGVRRDMLFFALAMAGAGILLINQNAQTTGIITLVPAALVAVLAPTRAPADEKSRWLRLPALLLIGALAIPQAAIAAVTLGYFSLKSSRPPSGSPWEARINGLFVQEGQLNSFEPGLDKLRIAYRNGSADAHTLNMARHAHLRQPLAQPEYLWTVEDAVQLLRRDPRLSGSVFVMDMPNPLNALLGRPAPRGVDAWNHAGRTFSEDVYRRPEEMFADVDVVMIPKAPGELATAQMLRRVYGPYIERNYAPAAVSDYWIAYRRRAASSGPSISSR